MLCISRVSISKPTIKAADVLEASRMCFADAKANMLRGEDWRPHQGRRRGKDYSAVVWTYLILLFFFYCAGLTILELCLVIAMKHLNDIYQGEPFNLQMVHNGRMGFFGVEGQGYKVVKFY